MILLSNFKLQYNYKQLTNLYLHQRGYAYSVFVNLITVYTIFSHPRVT